MSGIITLKWLFWHQNYVCSYIFFEISTLDVNLPKIAAAYEFKSIPIIGSLFEEFGCIFIKRGGGKDELNKVNIM